MPLPAGCTHASWRSARPGWEAASASGSSRFLTLWNWKVKCSQRSKIYSLNCFFFFKQFYWDQMHIHEMYLFSIYGGCWYLHQVVEATFVNSLPISHCSQSSPLNLSKNSSFSLYRFTWFVLILIVALFTQHTAFQTRYSMYGLHLNSFSCSCARLCHILLIHSSIDEHWLLLLCISGRSSWS